MANTNNDVTSKKDVVVCKHAGLPHELSVKQFRGGVMLCEGA
jgi:hypothetical protein